MLVILGSDQAVAAASVAAAAADGHADDDDEVVAEVVAAATDTDLTEEQPTDQCIARERRHPIMEPSRTYSTVTPQRPSELILIEFRMRPHLAASYGISHGRHTQSHRGHKSGAA